MSDSILHISPSLFRQGSSSPEVPSRFSSLSSISVHKPLIYSNRFHFNKICFVFKQQESKVLREEDIDDSFDFSPVSVPLERISGESQFDELISDTVVILWMAKWCRKCIYLKPKLEKLAADYYPRLRFYRVDVDAVPYKLVVRVGVTKMPTVQLWEDGQKQAEVIGGHKAYMVVNEIRKIIEKESLRV